MKVKSQKDFWSGLMFIVVGVAFAWGAATYYSFGSSARPGPGYFPFGLGVLLAILGAFVCFKALTVGEEGQDTIGKWAWRPLLWLLLSIAAFGFILPRAGMIASLPLLIIVCAMAGDEFRLKEAIINAVILTGGSYLVFIKGLNLTIPLWPAFLG